MIVRLTPRALSEAKRIKTWWQKNRREALDLFDDEMAAVLEQIRTTPSLGTIYVGRFSATVRRILMPETQNHLYYAIRENEVVVLSVWGAPRAPGPKL